MGPYYCRLITSQLGSIITNTNAGLLKKSPQCVKGSADSYKTEEQAAHPPRIYISHKKSTSCCPIEATMSIHCCLAQWGLLKKKKYKGCEKETS